MCASSTNSLNFTHMSELKYPFLDLRATNSRHLSDLKEAACRVLDSGRYIGGEECEAFEREMAVLHSTPHCVGVSNGLDAIRLIFRAYILLGRIAPGDEVIVPANTYIASVLPLTEMGLVPVPVDADPETLNMDTSQVAKTLTQATKAILTVHLYGRVCYDATLAELARRNNLLVIEDNAQAIGAQSATLSARGTSISGSLGDAAAFSFYPTKNIGAVGDAGAVVTADAELATTVRALANYGSDRRYHNIYLGYNCRMDPIQAAFLKIKLKDIAFETDHRRNLAALYDREIDNPLIVKPVVEKTDGSVWHQYVVRTDNREGFMAFLNKNGVGCDVHYATPFYRQPCYADREWPALPVTDRICRTVVSLPISTGTSAQDAREIAAIVNNYKG